jgi:hypothetical protein
LALDAGREHRESVVVKVPMVVMRLKDMHRVHPLQIESTCDRCGEVVAIFPSGQQIMKDFAGQIELVCHICNNPTPGTVQVLAPGAELEPFESKPKDSD